MKLFKALTMTVKAALLAAERDAEASGDTARLANLKVLHHDLADVATKHYRLLGFEPTELDGLVHTDGGGTPKD